MREVKGVNLYAGRQEENLPDFRPSFPYIGTYIEYDATQRVFAPWHWHKAIEVFYIQSGQLEYHTPGGTMVFSQGAGGMINSNVLHSTKSLADHTVPMLHIFDVDLITGGQGSLIEEKYILPVTAQSGMEIIPFYPQNPGQKEILDIICKAFSLEEGKPGYEIRLRNLLSEAWMMVLEQITAQSASKEFLGIKSNNKNSDKIKMLMVYVREHYGEKITIADMASATFLSQRECFRIFQDCLHTTPMDYVKKYRIQMACRMLADCRESVTNISQACGLGASSYFGKVFKDCMGCTPMEYRQKWQDRDI